MNFASSSNKGLFSRGTPDECPPNRLLSSINLMSKGPNIVPRPGFIQSPVATNLADVSHMSIFQPLPVAGVLSPKMIEQESFLTAGKYRIVNSATGNNIHNADQPYHSWVNFFGRGYFTVHDTIIGAQNEVVQVYEGGATSRPAAGVKPVSAMAGVLSGTPGDLGVGIYLIDVCYVTVSGFVTKPSGSVVQVSSFGSGSIDLTVIPTGGASVAKRQLVATKAINLSTYTGNPNDYEFFLVPNGLIADNVTTVFNLSFFDGNLNNTANILQDLLESIPAGLGIGEFSSRALVWGEYANNSVVRLSEPGEPESFSATSGLIVVDPTESGGVTNCISLRGTLYITKNSRVFAAADNGGDPSTWPITLFDSGIGTETYGVSQVLDSKGTHLNQFLIAARKGIILFDGVIRTPELTYWIEDIWHDIDPAQFSKVQIVQNPRHNHIYVLIPRNGGFTDILLGDYSDGLNPDTIKWYIWEHIVEGSNRLLKSITIQTNADNSLTVYISSHPAILQFNPDALTGLDNTGLPFTCTLQTPIILSDDNQQGQQITSVRIRQQNGQSTDITVQGITATFDPAKVSPIYTMPFDDTLIVMQDRWIYLPFVDFQPTLYVTINSLNKPRLSKIWVEGLSYGSSMP